jgi:hypothetical protein
MTLAFCSTLSLVKNWIAWIYDELKKPLLSNSNPIDCCFSTTVRIMIDSDVV